MEWLHQKDKIIEHSHDKYVLHNNKVSSIKKSIYKITNLLILPLIVQLNHGYNQVYP